MGPFTTIRAIGEKVEEPVLNEDGSLENFTVGIGGKLFRCSCGCNVFHKPDKTKLELYGCNGCDARYEGA